MSAYRGLSRAGAMPIRLSRIDGRFVQGEQGRDISTPTKDEEQDTCAPDLAWFLLPAPIRPLAFGFAWFCMLL